MPGNGGLIPPDNGGDVVPAFNAEATPATTGFSGTETLTTTSSGGGQAISCSYKLDQQTPDLRVYYEPLDETHGYYDIVLEQNTNSVFTGSNGSDCDTLDNLGERAGGGAQINGARCCVTALRGSSTGADVQNPGDVFSIQWSLQLQGGKPAKYVCPVQVQPVGASLPPGCNVPSPPDSSGISGEKALELEIDGVSAAVSCGLAFREIGIVEVLTAPIPILDALAPAVSLVILGGDCVASLGDAAQTVLGDPPDRAVNAVAIPALPRGVSPGPANRCKRGKKRAPCLRLLSAGERYDAAQARITQAISGATIAHNRYSTAVSKADRAAQTLQAGTITAWYGQLASALRQRNRAGLTFARELKRDHADVVLSAAEVSRQAARFEAGKDGAAAVKASLARLGYSATAAQHALTAVANSLHGALKLSQVTKKQVPNGALTRAYQTISVLEVAEIAGHLGLNASARSILTTDLKAVAGACTAHARRAAGRTLLRNIAKRINGRARSFLTLAAEPFSEYHAGTSPRLAKCR